MTLTTRLPRRPMQQRKVLLSVIDFNQESFGDRFVVRTPTPALFSLAFNETCLS